MPVELSSSSDEELRTTLRRNLRKDNGRPTYRSSRRNVFYNDEMIEVRVGTVYCPIRKKYFHTRQTRQDPAAFFGNCNLKKYKRPFLSSSSVIVWDATHGEGKLELCRKVTLENANDCGFYVFFCCNNEHLRPKSKLATSSLIQDFRYTRVVEGKGVTDELGSPSKFFVENDPWVPSFSQMTSRSVIENYFDGRFALCDMHPSPYVSLVDNGPILSMQSMDIDGFLEDSIINIHAIGERGVVVVGEKVIYRLHWNFSDSFHQFRGETTTLPIPSGPCVSSCSNSLLEAQYDPFVAIASQRSLYIYPTRAEVPVHMHKVCSFRDTPISALGTFSEGLLAGRVVLCGMRNGTIQIQPLQSSHEPSRFSVVQRHRAVSVGNIHCLRDSFNFVSVSLNGEVKLWDARFMSQKTPVIQIESGIQVGGVVDVQSAFVDDIGCVMYPDGRIRTLNVRKGLNLGELRRCERGKSRLHLTRNVSGYQIIDANGHNTLKCVLSIV